MASFRFSRATAPQRFATDCERIGLPEAGHAANAPASEPCGYVSAEAMATTGIEGMHSQEIDASALSSEVREALGIN
jgi:hypothetical protein